MKNIILSSIFCLSQIIVTAQDWTVFTVDNSLLPSNSIQSISVDQNNSKWIVSTSNFSMPQNQLIKIDANNQWTIFDETNSIISPNVRISSPILIDSNNNKWIGMENGNILQINDNSDWFLFQDYPFSFSTPIFDIAQHPDGRIFFVSGNLVSYDPITELWEEYNIYDEIERQATQLEIDENGVFWIADFLFFNGLLKRDHSGEWTIFNESLVDWEEITSLNLIDDELFIAHNDRTSFSYVTKWNINDNSNMVIDSSNYKNYGIINDLDENIWITYGIIVWNGNPTLCGGYCGDGVKKFDQNYSLLQHFHPDNSNLIDNMANAIALDADGTIWLGTIAGGLARYGETITSDNNLYPKLYYLEVFPNPFYDKLHLNIVGIEQKEISLKLFNGQGNLIFYEEKVRNSQFITFYCSNLPSGIYTYIITCGKDNFNGLLVKE